jgi:hypothetical protein
MKNDYINTYLKVGGWGLAILIPFIIAVTVLAVIGR